MSDAPPPGPFIPAGMPPGTAYVTDERPPDGVTWFRIYAVVVCLVYGLVALGGVGLMFAPLFMPHTPGDQGGKIALWMSGMFYGGWAMGVLTPTLIVLFSGRRPWVHTVGTVVIALGMFSFCCIPLLIPLLIVWMKPETKRWYGAR